MGGGCIDGLSDAWKNRGGWADGQVDVWIKQLDRWNVWTDRQTGKQAERQIFPEGWIVGCWMDGPVVGGQTNSGWNVH